MKWIKFRTLCTFTFGTRRILIDLNPDELHYYRLIVSSDRYNGKSNICLAISSGVYVDLNVFNMLTWKNESKTLIKHISRNCRSKLGVKKCNINQKWNNDNCQSECKNPTQHRVWNENYVWNLSTWACEIEKYF